MNVSTLVCADPLNTPARAEPLVATTSARGSAVQGSGSRFAEVAQTTCWVICAAAAFHIAYFSKYTAFLVLFYLFALLQLARASTWRKAFYPALVTGILVGAGQLHFFWRIFSGGAIALWLVLAFWTALFVALTRLSLVGLRSLSKTCAGREEWPWAWFVVPFLWCGLEYFRSELYYLRFSWLSPAFSFAFAPQQVPLANLGAYGVSLALMTVACVGALAWRKSRVLSITVLLLGAAALSWSAVVAGPALAPTQTRRLAVAGVQMEFPTEKEVLLRLNEAVRRHPEAQLLVLSEYTFSEPVPDRVKAWCREHGRYLIIGGTDPAPGTAYYNTAFVVSPAGEIIFKQVKSVPIQFFKDGLPAPEQRLWESPWGKIGICICYDLSYARVTDRLIRQGAQALIVPTMDVADWGRWQHELHARVAPIRAAEYGVPIFRLASSGISQVVSADGSIAATAPYPGDGSVIAGTLLLNKPGRLPLDRWIAPFVTGVAGLTIAFFLGLRISRKSKLAHLCA